MAEGHTAVEVKPGGPKVPYRKRIIQTTLSFKLLSKQLQMQANCIYSRLQKQADIFAKVMYRLPILLSEAVPNDPRYLPNISDLKFIYRSPRGQLLYARIG